MNIKTKIFKKRKKISFFFSVAVIYFNFQANYYLKHKKGENIYENIKKNA
jgi:hypothetical protein